MLYALLFAVTSATGFMLSRAIRRPAGRAQAAATARSLAGPLGARRGLTAPDLQRACFSEMVRHVRVGRDGRGSAPHRYVFHLNPADLAVVDEARRWFTDGLTAALKDAAATNGWELQGAVQLDYQADPSRRPGVPHADAVDPAPPRPDRADASGPAGAAGPSRPARPTGPGRARPDAAPERALALLRADTGERVPLRGAVVTIGRSSDNTIASLDERVSRIHARLEPSGSGWVLVDAGSANGTWVDGERIRPKVAVPIGVGTAIGIGPLQLRVTSDPSRPSSPTGAGGDSDSPDRGESGTRTLAAEERSRISSEVLGGPRRPRR